MAKINRFIKSSLVSFILGIGLTLTIVSLLDFERSNQVLNTNDENPLYWVAPMDPNYRRDSPGKSPMGMDLVPVYADAGNHQSDRQKGEVWISPEVVNNLGVRISEVKLQSLKSKIKTVGYVTYDEDQLLHIHPRVEGWIEKLHVKSAGNPVELNQPLYEIYSPALVNAQEELLLAIDRSNTRLIAAAQDRLRALQLPKSIIERIKKTRRVEQTIRFYSPQAGVVDNLNIREGFYVKPGTTIMSIGTLDHVWVEAEVFERQSSQVEQGLSVSMSLAYLPGKVWEGVVDYVYPILDPQTRTLKIRLRFENPQQMLKPNMFAQVIIFPDVGKESLVVPRESVIRSGNSDRVVLALGEGRFKSVNVKIGDYDEQFIEVLEGLELGDQVVSSAQFLLDSESSKNSDFKRMHLEEITDSVKEIETATVKGVVMNIQEQRRLLTINREAIKEWQRGPATIDFILSSSIDIKQFSQRMRVKFTFKIEKDEFTITKIKPIELDEQANGQHNSMEDAQ